MADVVYATTDGVELGVVHGYELDCAFGVDENDFELKCGVEPLLDAGMLLYMEGTEWGGIIDNVEVDETTSAPQATYKGRTWHGMLESSIVIPDAGADYFEYDMDANALIAAIIERQGIGSTFAAAEGEAGMVRGRFDRYKGVYFSLRKALANAGMRLDVERVAAGKTVLRAVPVTDYSEEMYSDQFSMKYAAQGISVNHLVCLGKGNLKDRQVLHLYADEEGNVSQTQSIFGMRERTEVYSNTSADNLLEDATKKLQELQAHGTEIELDLTDGGAYRIGDTIGCQSVTTGMVVTAVVNKLIVKAEDGDVPVVSFKVGNLYEEPEEEL